VKVTVKRYGKEFPLSNSKVMAIVLLFILAIILACYAGNFIGECWVHAVNHIIDNAEKHAEIEQNEEEKIIPIKVEDDELA
jgi:amino acid permease